MARTPRPQVDSQLSPKVSPIKVQGRIFMLAADGDGLRVMIEDKGTFRLALDHANYAAMASTLIAAQGGSGFVTLETVALGRPSPVAPDFPARIAAVGVGVGAVVLGEL